MAPTPTDRVLSTARWHGSHRQPKKAIDLLKETFTDSTLTSREKYHVHNLTAAILMENFSGSEWDCDDLELLISMKHHINEARALCAEGGEYQKQVMTVKSFVKDFDEQIKSVEKVIKVLDDARQRNFPVGKVDKKDYHEEMMFILHSQGRSVNI